MKKIFLFVGCCLLGWGTTDLLAQQGTLSAGGDATGSGGSVSFSIGQLDYLSATGSNGSIIQGLQQPAGAASSISGTLTYDNAPATALNNCTVYLKQGNTVMYQTTTDASGFYTFNNPAAGTYTVTASSTKAFQVNEVNATDALLILKHYIQQILLSGIRLAGADVNASTYVNSADALLVMKRFVVMINSFPAGDWTFEHSSVTIDGNSNLTKNLKGLYFGDVNGSATPPNTKYEPTLFLENAGVQTVDNYQIVRVPVSVKQPLDCAAASLVMNYPSNDLEILGVEAAYDNQNLMFNTIGDELRIGWYSLNPKSLNTNDIFVTLTMKLKNTNSASSLGNAFIINPMSSIADINGNPLLNKTLTMPALVNSNQGFALGNFPNPFNNTTQITYVLPEDGSVKLELMDVVGKQIAVLQEGQAAKGVHTYTFYGNNLTSGVYLYKMSVNTGSQEFTQTKRMIISR